MIAAAPTPTTSVLCINYFTFRDVSYSDSNIMPQENAPETQDIYFYLTAILIVLKTVILIITIVEHK